MIAKYPSHSDSYAASALPKYGIIEGKLTIGIVVMHAVSSIKHRATAACPTDVSQRCNTGDRNFRGHIGGGFGSQIIPMEVGDQSATSLVFRKAQHEPPWSSNGVCCTSATREPEEDLYKL